MDRKYANIDGIVHVADNLYKVDIEKIQVEKSSDEQDAADGDISFFNPRTLSETFDYCAAGCGADEMRSLQNSIQERGLLSSLIARVKDGNVSLINGHRRLNAIKQLIEQDELCYDPVSGTNKKAKDLYSNIAVKIFDEIDEIDAYLLAFEEDRTKVKFGAGTEYKFVQHCVDRDIEDSKITKMTGNNQSWLDSVKSLLNRLSGDNEILDSLFSNRMNIAAAKKLSLYENATERYDAFKEASKKAEEDMEYKKQKQEKSIINTKKKIENALAEKVQAKFSGNEEAENAADALIESYRAQEEQQKETLETIQPRVTGKNIISPPAKNNIGKRQAAKPKKDTKDKVSIGDQSLKVADIIGRWIHPLENLRGVDSNIPIILIDYTKELLDAVIDNEIEPQDFINKWVSIFENKGLVG